MKHNKLLALAAICTISLSLTACVSTSSTALGGSMVGQNANLQPEQIVKIGIDAGGSIPLGDAGDDYLTAVIKIVP